MASGEDERIAVHMTADTIERPYRRAAEVRVLCERVT
jgi:hypothetical protein